MMNLSRLVGWATVAGLSLQLPQPSLAQGTGDRTAVGTSSSTTSSPTTPVTVQNFARAETDKYFGQIVKRGALADLITIAG
jgi:hypothetical protein